MSWKFYRLLILQIKARNPHRTSLFQLTSSTFIYGFISALWSIHKWMPFSMSLLTFTRISRSSVSKWGSVELIYYSIWNLFPVNIHPSIYIQCDRSSYHHTAHCTAHSEQDTHKYFDRPFSQIASSWPPRTLRSIFDCVWSRCWHGK